MKSISIYLFLACALFFNTDLFGQNTATSIAVKNPEEMFVGAVLNSSEINDENHTTYPIINDHLTLSFEGLKVKSIEVKSNKLDFEKAVHESIQSAGGLPAAMSFSYTFRGLKSYEEIFPFFGQRVDLRSLFNIPDINKQRNNIVAIDIVREAFTVMADLPEDGKYVMDPNEIGKHNIDDLVYANSVTYGRRVFVIAESNIGNEDLLVSLRASLEGKSLSEKDHHILANTTFRIMTLGNDDSIDFIPNSPLKRVLEYLYRPLNADDYGYPISFKSLYLKNNGIYSHEF